MLSCRSLRELRGWVAIFLWQPAHGNVPMAMFLWQPAHGNVPRQHCYDCGQAELMVELIGVLVVFLQPCLGRSVLTVMVLCPG